MIKFFKSLFLGFVAGVIDVIPMIIQKLEWRADLSAFIFWLAMGIIISYSSFKMPGWLKGILTAEISAAPIMIIVYKNDIYSILPIFLMTALLGALVGFFSRKIAE